MAQQRSYQAEAKVEPRNWEKRNADIAFQEINQEFVSQRFQLHQTSRWADQAHRDKISLYGDLELTNRVFEENYARDCQQIEELRRICCEETGRARQARIDELSTHQEGNPTAASLLLTQIQELQNKVNSLSVRCERILRPWIGEQLWSDPRSQSTLEYSESQRNAEPRFWSAACGILWVLQETFLKAYLVRRTILYILQQFKEFGILLSRIETWYYRNCKETRVKWKENRWIRQSLYRISNEKVACWIILVELVLTVVWLILRNFRFRNCIWGNFRNLWNFKAEKTTSTLKHVRKQQTLISQCNRSKKLRWQSQLTNLWHRYRLWC